MREQQGGFGFELPQLALFLAEPLHDAHAGDRRLDVPHDLTGLLLGRPVRREQMLSGRRCDVPERGGHGEGHQGERRREKHHDHERQHEQQCVACQQRHEGEQSLDQTDVRDGPAHYLAGVQLVLRCAVQPGQRGEHVTSHVVLDVQGQPAGRVPPGEGEPVLEERRDDEGTHPHPDAASGTRWRSGSVDDVPNRERYGGRHYGAADGGAECHEQIPPVREAIGQQAL